jgi:hypothetical protein
VPVVAQRLVPLEPCQAARSATGASRFVTWVSSLTLEDLGRMSECYETFKEGELQMLRAQGVAKVPLEFQPRKHFTATRLAARLAMGAKFLQWQETALGKASKAGLRDFLMQTHQEHRHAAPKHKRKWLRDCVKAWEAHLEANMTLGAGMPKGRKATAAVGRTPEGLLMRRRGLQGRPFKSPEVRDMLWHWFVDIRASVACIITPKMLMYKAKELCERALQVQRRTGSYAALPDMNRM